MIAPEIEKSEINPLNAVKILVEVYIVNFYWIIKS